MRSKKIFTQVGSYTRTGHWILLETHLIYLHGVHGIHNTVFQDAGHSSCQHIGGNTRRRKCFIVVEIHFFKLYVLFDWSMVQIHKNFGPGRYNQEFLLKHLVTLINTQLESRLQSLYPGSSSPLKHRYKVLFSEPEKYVIFSNWCCYPTNTLLQCR